MWNIWNIDGSTSYDQDQDMTLTSEWEKIQSDCLDMHGDRDSHYEQEERSPSRDYEVYKDLPEAAEKLKSFSCSCGMVLVRRIRKLDVVQIFPRQSFVDFRSRRYHRIVISLCSIKY